MARRPPGPLPGVVLTPAPGSAARPPSIEDTCDQDRVRSRYYGLGRRGSACQGGNDHSAAGSFRASLALLVPVFWDVHKTSRIIVDEAMTTGAAAASAVIEEAGLGASRAVQVAGYALAVASLLVCSFALEGRRLLNRLAHMSHGNTALVQLVDSEAIYEISGSRSGKTHRVWVDLRLCTAACGCRAFLTEGVCGYVDAALAAAKAAGLCGSSPRRRGGC